MLFRRRKILSNEMDKQWDLFFMITFLFAKQNEQVNKKNIRIRKMFVRIGGRKRKGIQSK